MNRSCGPDGEDGKKEMVDGGEVQRLDSSHGALQPNSPARCTQQVHQKNGQKELTVSAHRAQECIAALEALRVTATEKKKNTREQEQVAAEEHSNHRALVF